MAQQDQHNSEAVKQLLTTTATQSERLKRRKKIADNRFDTFGDAEKIASIAEKAGSIATGSFKGNIAPSISPHISLGQGIVGIVLTVLDAVPSSIRILSSKETSKTDKAFAVLKLILSLTAIGLIIPSLVAAGAVAVTELAAGGSLILAATGVFFAGRALYQSVKNYFKNRTMLKREKNLEATLDALEGNPNLALTAEENKLSQAELTARYTLELSFIDHRLKTSTAKPNSKQIQDLNKRRDIVNERLNFVSTAGITSTSASRYYQDTLSKFQQQETAFQTKKQEYLNEFKALLVIDKNIETQYPVKLPDNIQKKVDQSIEKLLKKGDFSEATVLKAHQKLLQSIPGESHSELLLPKFSKQCKRAKKEHELSKIHSELTQIQKDLIDIRAPRAILEDNKVKEKISLASNAFTLAIAVGGLTLAALGLITLVVATGGVALIPAAAVLTAGAILTGLSAGSFIQNLLIGRSNKKYDQKKDAQCSNQMIELIKKEHATERDAQLQAQQQQVVVAPVVAPVIPPVVVPQVESVVQNPANPAENAQLQAQQQQVVVAPVVAPVIPPVVVPHPAEPTEPAFHKHRSGSFSFSPSHQEEKTVEEKRTRSVSISSGPGH